MFEEKNQLDPNLDSTPPPHTGAPDEPDYDATEESVQGGDLTTAASPVKTLDFTSCKVSRNEAEPELREKEERTGSTKTSFHH